MTSFKRAAIKILVDAKEPLHYKEITKRALEESLIETSGATPERTMNTQITGDMKRNKEKSAFIRVQPAVYSLNPDYAEEEQNGQEIEEKAVEEEKEQKNTLYTGKAGEHLVVSELLFRGFNASIMSVDEGLDIVATKGEHLYNIQVKTANKNDYNTYVFDLRISSFERHNRNNTFYIFVLREKNTRFVILPYLDIQKNVDQKNILIIDKSRKYRVNVGRLRIQKRCVNTLNAITRDLTLKRRTQNGQENTERSTRTNKRGTSISTVKKQIAIGLKKS